MRVTCDDPWFAVTTTRHRRLLATSASSIAIRSCQPSTRGFAKRPAVTHGPSIKSNAEYWITDTAHARAGERTGRQAIRARNSHLQRDLTGRHHESTGVEAHLLHAHALAEVKHHKVAVVGRLTRIKDERRGCNVVLQSVRGPARVATNPPRKPEQHMATG